MWIKLWITLESLGIYGFVQIQFLKTQNWKKLDNQKDKNQKNTVHRLVLLDTKKPLRKEFNPTLEVFVYSSVPSPEISGEVSFFSTSSAEISVEVSSADGSSETSTTGPSAGVSGTSSGTSTIWSGT